MFKRIDRSPFVSRMIDGLSGLAARQRGLPVVVGIVLLILGFVCQLLNFFIPYGLFEFLAIVFNGLGVITALIGLTLATPLGR